MNNPEGCVINSNKEIDEGSKYGNIKTFSLFQKIPYKIKMIENNHFVLNKFKILGESYALYFEMI